MKLAGRYAVEERLAGGGMGTVFVATDERLGRRVAIKVLKDELAQDPRFVERFRREARAAGALSHPNVAGVFDFGEDSGHHFMVMELARGRDLAHVLREEVRLPPHRAAKIGIQIAEALGHAHAAGLVHRDVKPANVILDEHDRVKVTDFGIARAAGDATLTATGSVLGTANYISPEQASGDTVTPATDVYSLGIVLYEMLTGTLPFTGDSALAVAMRHVSDEVPRCSELRPEVSGALDDVVARATAKSPIKRYATGSEMAADLASAMEPGRERITAVMTGPEATAEVSHQTVRPIPGGRWDPRSIGRAVLALFAFLILLAAALLVWRLATTADEEPGRAQAPAGKPAGQTPEETPEETPEQTGFTIPGDIVGMELHDAEELLKQQDLVVEKEDFETEEFVKDTVVDTEPPPGAEVFPGDTVTLFVSTGEVPEEKHGKGDEKGKDEGQNGEGHD